MTFRADDERKLLQEFFRWLVEKWVLDESWNPHEQEQAIDRFMKQRQIT